MLDQLSGATRLHFIVGDPIAQVKSPLGMTQAFEAHGRNAICVPAHVPAGHLADWLRAATHTGNVDGIIVTVPHKMALAPLCATLSERAAFLQAVNTLRRNTDGSWHGDMFDGLGYVEALRVRGFEPAGRRVLLVGAGGAGSAIAHALVMAGVAELVLHDVDPQRLEALVNRLASLGRGTVRAGPPDPAGLDAAINATPIGMSAHDPLPFDVSRVAVGATVGCVVTLPAVPPLIAEARQRGCRTVTGADMFEQVRDLMLRFLLQSF